MELKLKLACLKKVERVGFNRTFMELKRHIVYVIGIGLLSFNRTFMELKLRTHLAVD